MGMAWLLSRDGEEITVYKHPTPKYQFDEIVEVVATYGSDYQKQAATQYMVEPTDELYDIILNAYYENWCKVRTWGTFNDEVTFRINSNDFDWYRVIVDFLLAHSMFKNAKITVESDKVSGVKRTYWDSISYEDAISDENASVLSSVFLESDSTIV